MPVLDGYDACLLIREMISDHYQQQPYIAACTGNLEDFQVKKAFDSQFDELIQKPATVQVLTKVLEDVCDIY